MNETPVAPRSLSLIYRIAAALAIVLLVTITLSDRSATRLYTWPWFFYGQILFALPLLLITSRLIVKHEVQKFGGALDAGLLIFGAGSIISAWFSPYRNQSVILAWPYVSAVGLAYLVLDWVREPNAGSRRPRIESLSLFLGALFTLCLAVSFLEWLIGDVLPAISTGTPLRESLAIRNEHPYGHSIYTAGFAVLATPWLAILAWKSRGWRRSYFSGACALSILVILSTSSRGGVLGLLVTVLVAASAYVASVSISRTRRRLLLGAAVILCLGAVGANPRLRESVIHFEWNSSSSESNRQRAAMIEAGIHMGRERPWLGYGPGAVPLAYPRLRSSLSGGVDNVLELHNTPVQLWAELGFMGIASMTLLAIGVAAKLRANFQIRPENGAASLKIWSLTAGTALVAYTATALTDHQLDIPSLAATVACFLAVLGSPRQIVSDRCDKPGETGRIRLVAASLVGGATLFLAIASFPNLNARYHFSEALDSKSKLEFVEKTRNAAAIAPWDSFYPNQLAEFFQRERNVTAVTSERSLYTEQIFIQLTESLRREPGQEYAHYNLGWLMLENGDPAAADHFRAAAHFAPDKGGVYFGLGLSLLQHGQNIGAVHAFALEWLNDPQSMSTPFWENSDYASLRAEVTTHVLACYDRALDRVRNNIQLQQQITYAKALVQWWMNKGVELNVLIQNGDVAQRKFFRVLPSVESHRYDASQPTFKWELLYDAWLSHVPEKKLIPVFPQQTRFVEQLSHRLSSSPSFASIFLAPVNGEDSFSRSIRHQRAGYGVLRRQNEGMPLSDINTTNENRIVTEFFAFLFPAKGWLPAPVLLNMLDQPAP
jgi:O-antigen ligase